MVIRAAILLDGCKPDQARTVSDKIWRAMHAIEEAKQRGCWQVQFVTEDRPVRTQTV